MKTIKEESELIRKNSLFLLGVSKSIDYVTCADREQLAFEKGVVFAQQWIPIEEELPEDSDNLTQTEKYTHTENTVWVRTKNGKYTVSKRSKFKGNKNSKWKWIGSSSFSDSITHWRPIELL